MTLIKNKRTPKKTKVKNDDIHFCSEKELLNRIALILFGNGHPEDGLGFILREYIKEQQDIKKNVCEIRDTVKEALESSVKVTHAFEMYKLEISQFTIGKKTAEEETEEKEARELIAMNLVLTKKRDSWQRIYWIIAATIGILSIWITIYLGVRNNNRVDTIQSVVQKEENVLIKEDSLKSIQLKSLERLSIDSISPLHNEK